VRRYINGYDFSMTHASENEFEVDDDSKALVFNEKGF